MKIELRNVGAQNPVFRDMNDRIDKATETELSAPIQMNSADVVEIDVAKQSHSEEYFDKLKSKIDDLEKQLSDCNLNIEKNKEDIKNINKTIEDVKIKVDDVNKNVDEVDSKMKNVLKPFIKD